MVSAEGAIGGERHRQAEHPLEEVEIVRALVEQHAAAFAGPGRAPAAGGIVGVGAKPIGDDPIHPADFTEFATADEVADFLIIAIGALVEHRGEDLLLFSTLIGGDEALAIGAVNGNRFLHHDVQAGLECGDSNRGVVVVRRGNEDGVDEAGGDQLGG